MRVHGEKNFERTWHRRFPVTPPAQTLLDIANVVRITELRRALAEAEYLKLVAPRGGRRRALAHDVRFSSNAAPTN